MSDFLKSLVNARLRASQPEPSMHPTEKRAGITPMDGEWAEEIDIGLQWDVGAPYPALLQNTHHAFLAFYLRNTPPDWNGTTVHVRNSLKDMNQPIGVVRFQKCVIAMLGDPNDEVLNGHRLWGKGLEFYGAHIVHHSKWIDALMQINSVHNLYNPASWEKRNHYIFCFHDETFECIAESFSVESYVAPLPAVVQTLAVELFAN